VNLTHSGGQMNQECTIVPGARRQELQWSRVMMGIRPLTSFRAISWPTAVAPVFGSSLRSESSGIDTV